MSPKRSRLPPDGLIARIGLDLAHLREALADLDKMEHVAGIHSVAGRAQLRGARQQIRFAIESLEQAALSLGNGSDPMPRRSRPSRMADTDR